MKKYFYLAAAAALFAACSEKVDDIAVPDLNGQISYSETPVGFDVYTSRATTRAGKVDEANLTSLKAAEGAGGGFGIFAYYTNANEYDPQAVPNFMYNQKVLWTDNGTTEDAEDDHWEYSPVKYWPNEHGGTAISDDADKLTFFAYAPYVQVVPSTGKLYDASDGKDKWGITGMSRNSATGDPLIKYIASFDKAKTVDLCWGVYADGTVSENNWSTNGTTQSLIALIGKPWMNIQRPTGVTGQNVKFTFKHALSQLNVQVNTFVDGADNTNAIAENTKVYIRSISFTGMATKGSLNLNNTEDSKALWLDYNGTADLESGEVVTIYDGLKDGKEGTAGATASNEKTLGLHEVLISNNGNTQTGVTKDLHNLFAGTSSITDPVYIIPTGEEINVEIVYDIETADPNLSTYLSDGKTTGSRIENRIKKTITFGSDAAFVNGKKYTLLLHLGMNSVKFDAAVTEWVAAEASGEGNLPAN